MTDQLIIVDLGQLSKTQFGTSVKHATLQDTDGSAVVHIETEAISKDFVLEKSEPVGTYVIYDKQGTIIGATREMYSYDINRAPLQ